MDCEASAGEALDALLMTALTRPTSVDRVDLDALLRVLRPDPAGEGRCALALSTLAAVLYTRPDLVDDAVVDRLGEIVALVPLSQDITGMVVKLLEFLASSPWAPRAWAVLGGLLRDERVGPATRDRLVTLVGDFVRWRDDLVGLDGVLSLAASPTLAGHRAFLLDYGLEPFVFSAPECFTAERLDRVGSLFAHTPRYGYFLYALAARQGLGDQVRTRLTRELAGRFPLQGTAAAILAARPLTLLVVNNLGIGQGDDIVRLVPLLQALLDVNPALSVVLITHRPYLYEHPRVAVVPIDDDVTVQATLREPLDGVIEVFQPGWDELAVRPRLHTALEHLLRDRPLRFVVRAGLGRPSGSEPGIRSEFVYQTVELDGHDVAASRGLDQRGLRNIYEPLMRLQAELGLPQRAAGDPPVGPSVLTGLPSADAERLWWKLVGKDEIRADRPVALVNPFGGSMPTKGFLDQPDLLAAEIGGLVDEGYVVVLLSNGTPWGGQGAVVAVLSRLTAEARARTRIAPDPTEPEATARFALEERPDLAYADRITRLFKYFASYAHLVVTVEGWMAHLAYCLGRPFRLFPAASSFPFDWYPYGRGPTQRLVTMLSPCSRAAYSTSALLGEGDPPPLPHRPRKTLLELALAGLGRSGRGESAVLLRRALVSADNEVRTWALAALARLGPPEAIKADLLAALEEREPAVVRAAAEGLLRGGVDCSRELGPQYRDLLTLQADITRHNWAAVERLGAAALPILFRAAKSESHGIRHEARSILRRVLAGYVPELSPDPSPAG